MNAKKHADGELPAAVARLQAAICTLIDPQQQIINGQHYQAESLYMQLWDATPSGTDIGRRAASSTACVWVDALQLRIEIDQRIEIEQPQPIGTVPRLRVVAERSWKPQQTSYVHKLADAIGQWVKEIDELLNPKPKWTLPAPCPQCGERWAYYRDSAGERARQPALQIGTNGVTHCANHKCDASWDVPLFLCRLLGYELPEGVLE